jgi:hypothetical protein
VSRRIAGTLAVLVALEGVVRLAALPPAYVGGLLVFAGLALWRAAAHSVWAALAMGAVAYLGDAAAPFAAWRLGLLTVLALVVVVLAERPWLPLALVTVSLAGVGWVLGHSVWAAEASLLGRLATGLAAFTAAFVGTRLTADRRLHWLALAALALPCWRGLTVAPGLPAAATLAAQLRDANDTAVLEQLRAAGYRDAGYAWAAAAVRQNSDPEQLRSFCPGKSGGRGDILDGRFASDVAMGKSACTAVLAWPEVGAAQLLAENNPALKRLGGDLLMDAGAVDQAVTAYARAEAEGDAFARRDAAQALLRRGRRDLAAHLSAHDAAVDLWLDPDRDEPALWQTWSTLHDYADLAPAARRGDWPSDLPGKTHAVFDAQLGRRVLATRSRYAQGFALALSPTPAHKMPARLTLVAKSLRGLRVYLEGAQHSLVYACDEPSVSPGDTFEPLPDSVCAGEWGTAVLEPKLADSLTRIVLRGDFRLASISAEP